jgi:hypothetical protein
MGSRHGKPSASGAPPIRMRLFLEGLLGENIRIILK